MSGAAANILQFVREEDFVEYFLFPELPDTDGPDNQQLMNQLEAQIVEVAADFAKNYIWHKDNFQIRQRTGDSTLLDEVLTEATAPTVPHFHGVSHFGDNIQDEWLIVAILLELTRKIKGLAVRVLDSDGEFLLIEAANQLPKWADPETCEGKVYLYSGLVHIVQDADPLSALRANPNKFCISNAAFEPIQDRVSVNVAESLHRATVFVPIGVAGLLHRSPQLIAKAVLAFCNRDPIDVRAIKAMRYFPPEDCIYTSVVFTKCLYAMLSHNQFIPDRRTGWKIPPTNSPEHRAHLLGVKLACGFEILACQGKTSTKDLSSDKQWLNYLESLKKRGYFQVGNLTNPSIRTILSIIYCYKKSNFLLNFFT